MAIQVENEIKKIDVIASLGELSNVIKRVIWEITFTDAEINPEVNSKTIACAILDTTSLEDFTEIDSTTDEQILEWAYAQHGGEDNFLEMVTPRHVEELQRKADCYDLSEYDRDLQEIVESTNEYDFLF